MIAQRLSIAPPAIAVPRKFPHMPGDIAIAAEQRNMSIAEIQRQTMLSLAALARGLRRANSKPTVNMTQVRVLQAAKRALEHELSLMDGLIRLLGTHRKSKRRVRRLVQ
ncbi:MAG: hypothetical protein ACKVP3_21335 [Hyphomicrobiaceae bacterium]